MKAYCKQHYATGKWYAYSLLPPAEFWGETPREAKDKLTRYLRKHYDIRLTKIESQEAADE